jgi:membrane-bound lytic murein transglycosylase D
MKIDVFKHITFLVIFLCFSCSLHTNQTLSQQPGQLPEAAPAGTDNSNENISDEKIYSYGIPYDYVEEFNYLGNNDGLYEIRSGLKDINGESLLISHNADNEENIKVDAEESPADEEKGQNLLDSALDFINTSQEYWSEGNLDKAIATLDEAYTLVVKVDIYVNPDLVQQKEDLRFMISRRILEIYASRYTATNGNHNEIPLTLNEHVEKEIKRFQGRERRFFMESYKRSGRYMPKILESLREAGLPDDLAWLPLIESGFKVRALSRARALGLWQFIPSTGYKFGLKRDTWIDERLDPEKATAAAIAYMKELHKIFGDWTTVIW